MLDCI